MSAHKMIAILFSLFLMGISGTVCAQTFSSLPESERNAKLIEVAKYVYKNPRWEYFYREYGTPEIESFVIEGEVKKKKKKSKYYGIDLGSLIYVVIFRYDKTKESMEWDYAAKVYISDKGGFAYGIALGNGMILDTYRNEQKSSPMI